MNAKEIEVWWKRIGCQRQPSFSTGEQVAMAAEIKDLREELDARLDCSQLLRKYMRLVLDVEGIDFISSANSICCDTQLSKEDLAELKVISKEVRNV